MFNKYFISPFATPRVETIGKKRREKKKRNDKYVFKKERKKERFKYISKRDKESDR